MIVAINNYESVLDKAQVPACLQQADRDLRVGLELEKQGAQQGINGIDASDPSGISAGAALIGQGSDSIVKASNEISNSNCL
ncbi:hypothetical protein EPN29_00325 [bacterium]|nr:MAG: hypothetical protein EPN29_00325 [bacterium]